MRKIKLFVVILAIFALCITSFAIGRLTLLPVNAVSEPNTAPEQTTPKPSISASQTTSDASNAISAPPKASSYKTPASKESTPEEAPKLSRREKNELVAAEYSDLPLDALDEETSYKIYRFYKADSTFICFIDKDSIVQYRDQKLVQSWGDYRLRYGDELIDISCLGENEPAICIINEHEIHARHQLIELHDDGSFGLFHNLIWVERDPGTYNDLYGLVLENGTLYSFSRRDDVIETEKILDDVVDAGYGGPYIVVAKSDGIAYMKLSSSFYGEYDDSANRYLVLGDSEYWTPNHVASSWKSYISPGFTNYPTTGEFTWYMKGDHAEFVEFD